MLRLQVSCRLVPDARPPKYGNNGEFSVLRFRRVQYASQWVGVKALRGERGGGGSGFLGGNWDPGLEIEVPFEQRPVNEYSSLKDGPLYSWGELSPGPFFIRLGSLWLVTFTVLGVPIAAASFNPSREPLRFALAAGTGTLFIVSLVLLRIYLITDVEIGLKQITDVNVVPIDWMKVEMIQMEMKVEMNLGWSYVGDRLLSAVVPYEESGWYDGQMWVKPPEVLARDRLLGSYKVKPVIKLMKQTLVGTGALLVSAVLLFIFATPVEDFFQNTFIRNDSLTTSMSNQKSNMRTEELLRLPVEVKDNDDLAKAAAEAADGRPVYCRDRFYRALAGGQYCKWDDLVN
ncbi:hypothetical protein GIB67_030433 [Kingdonia uniflora]|uniref:Uncharacterized protein n=1 Tax=Kingdonia uniflora TaxID=39325 RepID=A0A7J7NDD8_9MAGN|nr:hypothetical protein GIB67_030433 [Kingdonia uniflora]